MYAYLMEANCEYLNISVHNLRTVPSLDKLSLHIAGVANHHIKWSHIREAVKDPLTWIYCTIILARVTPKGIFGTFGNIIIKSLGFKNLQVMNPYSREWLSSSRVFAQTETDVLLF